MKHIDNTFLTSTCKAKTLITQTVGDARTSKHRHALVIGQLVNHALVNLPKMHLHNILG